MHFFMLGGTDLKLGMGEGVGPKLREQIVKVTPSKVKGNFEFKLPYKWPMATKFGRKNSQLKCNALQGSKVMHKLIRVNQRLIA